MRTRFITSDTTIGARRGEVVVCLQAGPSYESLAACARSVLAHTPASVPILICDPGGDDDRQRRLAQRLGNVSQIEHELFYLTASPAQVALRDALAAAAPADVLLLRTACIVGPGWLDGLRDAACAEPTIATAMSLADCGCPLAVPGLGRLPQEWNPDEAAGAVRRRSLRFRPRVSAIASPCVYLRRSALDLAGGLDGGPAPELDPTSEFSARCVRQGLVHVVADDVLVMLADPDADGLGDQEPEVRGPLPRSLALARRALAGLRVTVDARAIQGLETQAASQMLELIAALARSGAAHLTALVPDALEASPAHVLKTLDGVRLVRSRDAGSLDTADVVHRLCPLNGPDGLTATGGRLVVWFPELIADRALLRRAAIGASRVVFSSEHARREALAEEVIDPARAEVVRPGLGQPAFPITASPRPPRGAARIPSEAEVVLCLGSDARQENRLFAIRLLDQLQRLCGWEGRMVFAGAHVAEGSSAGEEDELLALRPRLADATVDLAAVDRAEELWLLRRARLVVFPHLRPGARLVPFQAAREDVPCLWAATGAAGEVLPRQAAAIVPWDAAATAPAALALIRDEAARRANLEAIRNAGSGLTWQAAAEGMLEVYDRALAAAGPS